MNYAVGTPNAPILIVEDNEDGGTALEELLTDEGFVVTRVSHPDRAEPLLRTSCFSLIMTDYHFNSADESERAARALLRAADDVPVGCITGWNAVPPDIDARYAFKMVKPLDVTALLATVARFAAVQAAEPEKAAVIERYFGALGRRDWAGLVALCTESVCYHLPGTDNLCRAIAGREAFRAYAATTFAAFPDARFDVHDIAWLPHGVVAAYRASWSGAGDSLATGTGAVYFGFRGNEIATIGVRTDVGKLRATADHRA